MWDKPFQSVRLLVAMDHEQMREGFVQVIRGGGGRAFGAANDREAAEQMRENHFNMFLLSDRLPKQGGISFARFLRIGSGQLECAPIILGMHAPSREKIFAARDAGVNAVTALPMNIQVFNRVVTGLVSHPGAFVQVSTYNGPDRRKKAASPPKGERRKGQVGLVAEPKVKSVLFGAG